jgi:hypothetical protein
MTDRKRNEDIREEVGETNVDRIIKIPTWRPDATAESEDRRSQRCTRPQMGQIYS